MYLEMPGALMWIPSPEESRFEPTNEFSQGRGGMPGGTGGSLAALEEQRRDPGLGSWPCRHEHPTFQGCVFMFETEGPQWREKHRACDSHHEMLKGFKQRVTKERKEKPSRDRPWVRWASVASLPLSYPKS